MVAQKFEYNRMTQLCAQKSMNCMVSELDLIKAVFKNQAGLSRIVWRLDTTY